VKEIKPHERPRLRWIHLAEDRVKWRAVLNIVMNLQVVKLSALNVGRHLPLGIFLILISVTAIVLLEGLGQLKNPVASSRI
jgi:hypothetical protein